jgi:hypothetical protein
MLVQANKQTCWQLTGIIPYLAGRNFNDSNIQERYIGNMLEMMDIFS